MIKMRELNIHLDQRDGNGDHVGATITVVLASDARPPAVSELAASVHVVSLGDSASDLTFATGPTERAALLELAARWEAMAREILRVAESLPMTPEATDADA